MAVDTAILFAISTMLSWGVADFFAKKAIDKIGFVTALVLNLLISLGPILVYAVVTSKVPAFSINLFLLTIAVGALGLFGYFFMYKGFEKGKASVVSPISASWSVITVFFAIFAFGEVLAPSQIVGILTISIGIFLASGRFDLKQSPRFEELKGIKEAMLAMISWGIAYSLLKYEVALAGPIMAVFFLRALGFLFLFSWVRLAKANIKFPTALVLLLLLAASGLDTIGFITYNIGITSEFVSIVGPIAATYPAITTLLAYFFLKERIVNCQKIGIACIIAGLALIAFA